MGQIIDRIAEKIYLNTDQIPTAEVGLPENNSKLSMSANSTSIFISAGLALLFLTIITTGVIGIIESARQRMIIGSIYVYANLFVNLQILTEEEKKKISPLVFLIPVYGVSIQRKILSMTSLEEISAEPEQKTELHSKDELQLDLVRYFSRKERGSTEKMRISRKGSFHSAKGFRYFLSFEESDSSEPRQYLLKEKSFDKYIRAILERDEQATFPQTQTILTQILAGTLKKTTTRTLRKQWVSIEMKAATDFIHQLESLGEAITKEYQERGRSEPTEEHDRPQIID
jgi:hypothetical protein